MTITNQNVEVNRGDNATLFVALIDEDGNPFNVATAGDIKWRVTKTAHSDEIDSLIRKGLNNGITPVEGGINIDLSPVDTNLDSNIYYHELKVYGSVLGSVATAMTGAFIIRRSLKMAQVLQAEVRLFGGGGLSAHA